VRSIETEVTIRGTPEQVWAVLIDFAKYPDWNPFIRHISGAAVIGARLTVRIQTSAGRSMTFRPTVRQAASARELRWLGHLGLPGLFGGEHAFLLEPIDASHTRVEHREQFRGVVVPLVPKRLFEGTRRGFEEMNRALRRRVEAVAPGTVTAM
jgi:hypothetical protein